MSLLVIGSIALDTLETPFGKVEYAVGGSGTFISTSASYFYDDIKLIGIVGTDFPNEELEFLKSRNIDISGVLKHPEKKTFHWHGKYNYDLNTRDSIVTELNAFEDFNPEIPASFRDSPYICLGNVDPEIQLKVINQLTNPKIIMMDTMNFWIEMKKNKLFETMKHVNIISINDSEARELTGEYNLVSAAKRMKELGPEIIVIKKGEHGALLFNGNNVFAAPALPLENVFDPTGAGDSFAGGFMGWIAGTDDTSLDNLKLAMIYGSAIASISVEKFSLEGLRELSNSSIEERLNSFKNLTQFDFPVNGKSNN
ncbi:MAG: PfkB family carbohydrate kinase [Ignavibacteriaceae bacterium]|jgi:sugar/nucleoside kinase (ribokinase family)|nr:MAG: sugar kinase [Chlorobiota bacterium]KXK02663.1 MAG: ribokinase family sugar kinase [Chlorobi bacterium OLB4]MBV6398718.1 putative sugar kinase YdjH [Ignavibacteria bacterium]MCC6885112.1 sugar kinase [Ignavibacteriales bacterium]MCE7952098.1 sugar kinase [Chlorobi bacterium CHB7]MDL1886345.1 sugar kinase [Ignavibacteria bacterium CHB1]MEB2329384.1 PfkB family carbohydrate kinase [Ignavibacteriaceae bacterium]OQY78890.1 MAG: sugar kinase [Ignavibacteriales bacterium UTCHB1]RIK48794.1